MTRCHCSSRHAGDEAVRGDAGVVHEQLDGAERRPRSRRTRRRRRPGRRRRRAPRARRRRPPRRRRCVAFAPSSSLRVAERDPVPGSASATAQARPMPRDAPVTNAVRGARVTASPSAASALAQVMPAPKPDMSTRSPSREPSVVGGLGQRERDRRRRRVAVAVDVHDRPVSAGMPSRLAADSMMRTLAWCGTNQSTSDGRRPRRARASSAPSRRRPAPPGGTPPGPASSGTARRRRSSRASPACGSRRRGSRAGRSPSRRSRGPRRGAPGPSSGERLEHDGGGAVAEEDARRPVVGVDDAGEGLGADDEHVVEPAGAEQRRADDEHVDEAGAAGAEVEGAAAQPEALADERAGVGDRLLRAWRSRR